MLNAFNNSMTKYVIFTCMLINIISKETINKKSLKILVTLEIRIYI